MALSERQMLDALSRTPFVDSTELALILSEPHATVHRTLAGLLAEGIVGRASHGTAHLPSSQRYHLTTQGIREAACVLGFETPSDFVRAYPMSREWLTLLIRRMDAVASVYRLAASMSPGIDGLRSRVEFHRRGRFDATITFRDGRSDQRQLLLPVDADYSCRSWGETIWCRRYRIGHRSAGSATEAEANGRQESTRGGSSIWYERADGADVAARQAAVGEEGQAEVANPTGPVRRGVGRGGRAPSAERR